MHIKHNLIYLLLLISVFSFPVCGQEVKMAFSVLDENGMFLSELKKEDFQVLQDKKPLSISSFETKNSQSLDIAIMIDASGSQSSTLSSVKQTAKNFITNFLGKNDRVSIVRFANELTIEQSLTENFESAKQKIDKISVSYPPGTVVDNNGKIVVRELPISQAINITQGGSGSLKTSLWDSIKITTQKSFDTQSQRRKIILLFTDGYDNFSENQSKEILNFLTQTKIPVYSVGTYIDVKSIRDSAESNLKKIAEYTGGDTFKSKKITDFTVVFNQIEQSSRSFYEISFTPNPTSKNDKLNEVKIELVNPSLRQRKLRIIQPKGFSITK